MNKDLRIWLSSAVFVVLLILIAGYLTFIPVPTDNKDIIVVVIGVITGGAAGAMRNLFGSEDQELEKLKLRVRELEESLAVASERYQTTKTELDDIKTMLVERHVIHERGIQSE